MTTLKEKIIAFMSDNPNKEYSATEVADHLMEIYTDEYEAKTKGQLDKEVSARFSRMERENNMPPQIRDVEGSKNPKRRYWDPNWGVYGFGLRAGHTDEESPPKSKRETKRKNRQGEKELYKPLQEYLYEEQKIKAMIIHESASSNRGERGSNKHRHPDIVGVQGMISNENYHLLVQQLYVEYKTEKAKMWSFEVKEKITAGTVRDCYNQADSNSSWADYGYLCVGSIEGGEKTKNELARLTAQKRIGVIVINKNQPLESKILIRAKPNPEVNLAECSYLAEENPDFRKFLEYAINVYKTGKVY